MADELYAELLRDLWHEQAMRHLAETRLAMARERIDQLRELVDMLPDYQAPELEPVTEENPFA